MSLIGIVSLGLSLSMDAFAVSICKGMSTKETKIKNGIIIGLYFGFFQALMPTIGYFLGKVFYTKISSIDHWIIFGLLLIIGTGMIRESFDKETKENSNLDFITLLLLAIATSIDAFAAGITLALLKVNVLLSVTIIGIITFILSIFGYLEGNKLGEKYGSRAELIGGLILILLGTKILLEHLGIF